MNLRDEGGAAMMISLIFFIVASVMVVIGMTGPTAREYATAGDSLISKQSYFAAESAAEDAYYREINASTLGSTDILAMPLGTATAEIASGVGSKEITSTGNVQNSQRVVDLKTDDGSTDWNIQSWAETQ